LEELREAVRLGVPPAGRVFRKGRVNCSGGVNATNAIGASAMERPAEAALQIMGKADNQVPKTVHTSIGHGWGGSLNLCTLMVMSDEPQRKWR